MASDTTTGAIYRGDKTFTVKQVARLSGLKPREDVVVIGGGPIGVLVAMVARDAGGKVVLSEVNPHRSASRQRLLRAARSRPRSQRWGELLPLMPATSRIARRSIA